MSIATIARHVADAFGYTKPIVFDTRYSDGQHQRTVTNAKLMSRHPTFRFTPLRDAIRESVDWFRANRATARL